MTTPEAILCIDLDGTLLDPQEQIHPQDIKILENFPGNIQPVITTGRNVHSAKAVLHQNGLNRFKVLPWPGVFMNGGAGLLPSEKCIIQNCFPEKLLIKLIKLSKAITQSSFAFFTINTVYLVNPNPFSKHINKIHYLKAVETLACEIPEEVIKMMILDQDREKLLNIQKMTLGWEAEMGFTLPYLYEFNPVGITKASTLLIVLEALGLSGMPIFTVGDAENDLSLFTLAHQTFAPNNAQEIVKARADRIIPREKRGILKPILEEMMSQNPNHPEM